MPEFNTSESSKAPKYAVHEAAQGVRINAGPFIGRVKNNIDPMRAGRLQVFIPELGGDPDDPTSWRTVAYASPFFGVTPPPVNTEGKDTRGKSQDYYTNPHSYGMWFVPPDLNVEVMCMFVNGDPFRGYWFACVPDWPNMHMVPGIGRSDFGAEPVVDYNIDADSNPGALIADFYTRQKTPHTDVVAQLNKQGLINDPLRGPITSNPFRESPSGVFGFNTPGRRVADPYVRCDGQHPPEKPDSDARMAGHSLVMDDGDTDGNNQLMRLRSASGHQIMMSDVGGFIHIINANGTSWLEMDQAGNINIFANGQFNVHAEKDIQFESAKGSINLNSKKSININARMTTNISSIGGVNIQASGAVKVSAVGQLHLVASNTYLTGKNCIQIMGGKHIDMSSGCITLNSVKASPGQAASAAGTTAGMPQHEPWSGHSRCSSGTSNATALLQQSIGTLSGVFGSSGNWGGSSQVIPSGAGAPDVNGLLTG